MYKRAIYQILKNRAQEPRKFIQVLAGPRQAGKTVLARQLIDDVALPCHYASADEPILGREGTPTRLQPKTPSHEQRLDDRII